MFAHELGHVLLRNHHVNGLPPRIEEGLAEYVAHTHLTRAANGIPSTTSVCLANAITTSADPV